MLTKKKVHGKKAVKAIEIKTMLEKINDLSRQLMDEFNALDIWEKEKKEVYVSMVNTTGSLLLSYEMWKGLKPLYISLLEKKQKQLDSFIDVYNSVTLDKDEPY